MLTTQEQVERPPTVQPLPDPEPIRAYPFDWDVMRPDRLPEGDWVRYGITPQEYENLSRTMADMIRWAREAKWRLDYYRRELTREDSEQETTDGR